jgi:hypothetical protein
MSDTSPAFALPEDVFLDLLGRDDQVQAARLVQEGFAAALRLSQESEGKPLETVLARLADRLREWSRLTTPEGAHLRLSLLMYGLDQWGLAYAKVFGADTLYGVTVVLSDLRGGLDLSSEGMCQRHLDTLREDEGAGLEFKIVLRRELHLSLWHSMIAAESPEQGDLLLSLIGGLLLALLKAMPNLGWRLVADTLASIQIRCLQHGLAASGQEQTLTEALFAGLTRDLPDPQKADIFAHAAQAVRDWQESRRATQH